MPTLILGPNQNVPVTFKSGKRGAAEIYIEASGPVTVYVTTAAGRQAFLKRKTITPVYATARDVEVFEERVRLPPNTECLLLIVNYDTGTDLDDARAIYHRVSLGK